MRALILSLVVVGLTVNVPHDAVRVAPVTTPICRIGHTVPLGRLAYTAEQLAPLGACMYHGWKVSVTSPTPRGEEFIQLVKIHQARDCEAPSCAYSVPHSWVLDTTGGYARIDDATAANPGALWLIGNEPDCIYQDNMLPEVYAWAYHDLYNYIVARDSTARISAAGIVMATPARLAWLDRVLAEYQARHGEPLPVHTWNIHNYIIGETTTGWSAGLPPGMDSSLAVTRTPQDAISATLAHDQLIAFRQWMASNGQQGKPLIVTEYGGLPTDYFDDDTVAHFVVTDSLQYMLNTRHATGLASDDYRLVQGSLYFALDNYSPGYEHLINLDGTLTTLGNAWAKYVNGRTTYIPLLGYTQ